MEKPAHTGLRKRQQIAQANKLMFLWIAGVSVIVGVSLVLVIFLTQKIWFGEKVISEKNKTVSTLQKNLSVINDLKDNIRVVNTNSALNSTKINDSDLPIQSVLDALPATANSTGLASSLQTKLLAGVPGITIVSISVDSTSDDNTQTFGSSDQNSNQLGFTFSVSTSANTYNALSQVLERLEKSIRPFSITNLSIEGQGTRVVMTATGVSYYLPAQTLQLTQKVVKP